MKKFNWQIWAGFLLTLFAFLSYPFIFIDYPILRDFPWLNLLLFALALVLLFIGLRRALRAGHCVVHLRRVHRVPPVAGVSGRTAGWTEGAGVCAVRYEQQAGGFGGIAFPTG